MPRNEAMPPETMAGTGQTLCAELDMMNSQLFLHLGLHHIEVADEDVRFDVVDEAHLLA